jgi:hypothetical protein
MELSTLIGKRIKHMTWLPHQFFIPDRVGDGWVFGTRFQDRVHFPFKIPVECFEGEEWSDFVVVVPPLETVNGPI